MPDPYEELDVFGRPKSRVAGVPYVEPDDDLAALQNYVLNLEAKKAAIESGARTVRKPKEIVREGGRLPGYVHQYEPGYTVAEQERLRDETDPVRFMPIVRQGVGNVQAIMEEGPEKWDLIKDKTFGPRLPRQVNKLGGVSYVAQPATFDERFYGPVPRTEMWPEKMTRSGASLPGDVMSGRVMTGPGLRSTDFSDVPGAPNPLSPLIERTQDLAGMAMGGSIPELAARGVDRNALGSGFVPKQVLTNELRGGTNVPEAAPRNIGRETMPEILARQRASEGYEAAIRDPETKKLYTGMWHEEVLDKIAKDRGVPKDQLPTNLVKGYVNDRGRFLTEEAVERMSQNRSKTAMFRADDEVGAAVAAMHAAEGKAPELKVGQANLPAVIPQGGLPAPGTALNPISNRRGFMRGARDLMAAASNANKIVSMAEKLGQTPIPKNPKVPLKEIWKTDEGKIQEITDGYMHDWVENTNAEREESGLKLLSPEEIKNVHAEIKEQVRENPDGFSNDYYYDSPGTQFSHHQLPGATNYREHLMQMPSDETGSRLDHNRYLINQRHEQLVKQKPGISVEEILKDPTIKRLNDEHQAIEKAQRSSFYGDWDEPDIIGHSRVNDRQIPGVGKALHIEEIGSQLHEAGAKHGYGARDATKIMEEIQKLENIKREKGKLTEEQWKQLRNLNEEREKTTAKAPDLPFKKTYVDLAVNRMLHEAATQGYNAVSWTSHDLQKQFSGSESNKEILPRIEALAKKYGGKVEKQKVVAGYDVEGKPSIEGDIHVLKLTPEMKRIFGHDDFSFFPKQEAAGEAGKGFKLRSDSEAGAAIGALRNSVAPTFYSGLARTIERAPFETGTPSQWMKHLRDTVGARQAEEFEHVGLEGRLGPLAEVKAPVERKAQAALETWKAANKGQRPPKELIDAASNENKRIVEQRLAEKGNEKPLTKAELLAHVASNQPKFKEIVKRGTEDDNEAAIHNRAWEIMQEEHPTIGPDHPRSHDYFADAVQQAEDELHQQGGQAKYSDYQLPGGTNYREHLMTMPPETWYASRRDRVGGAHYSSHWDEPNVIVHTRMNDRMLGGVANVEDVARRIAQAVNATPETIGSGAPAVAVKKGLITPEEAADWSRGRAINEFSDKKGTGVRSLHAEEFQSDLHQEGRKQGYKSGKSLSAAEREREETSIQKALREHEDKNPGFDTFRDAWPGDLRARWDALYKDHKAVPNFPFKKSWPDLAIKRWLREAVDNDYDAVSWTPGEAQRDRFQLSHSLEALHYNKRPNGYTLFGDKKGGGDVLINRGMAVKEDELSRYVGDAMAEKIKKGEGHENEDGSRSFNNQDLKVGGEGLVSFYDKTIKGKVEALVEKFGGKVEKHEGGPKYTGPSVEQLRKELKEHTQRYHDKAEPEYHQKYQELYNKLGEAKKAEEQAKSNSPVWSVKLTPEMKRAIRSEGFPLFSAGPVMTPVDHDPFDKKQKPKPKLEPVEHDPFAQPTPDLGGTLNKLISATGGYRPRPRPIQNGFGRRQ